MQILVNILLVINVFVCIALIAVVLIQRSEGGALGMGGGGGGGGMGGLFSPRGAADTLTRATTILAILFFFTCIGLNLLALHGRPTKSLLETTPTNSAPAVPVKPLQPAVPTQH